MEIKFKAKTLTIAKGTWVYGNYVFARGRHYILQFWTDSQGYDERWEGSDWLEIDINTLGQYIGLSDKTSKEIYSGDILEIKTDLGRIEKFTVEWGIHKRWMKSGFEVEIPSFAFVSEDGFPTYPILNNYINVRDMDIIKVIGNIHN